MYSLADRKRVSSVNASDASSMGNAMGAVEDDCCPWPVEACRTHLNKNPMTWRGPFPPPPNRTDGGTLEGDSFEGHSLESIVCYGDFAPIPENASNAGRPYYETWGGHQQAHRWVRGLALGFERRYPNEQCYALG